jgi:quercetin dioxygenase-like cupin family protein
MFACAAVSAAYAHDPADGKSKVTLVFDRELPNVPGKSMRGVLVEYEPGGG